MHFLYKLNSQVKQPTLQQGKKEQQDTSTSTTTKNQVHRYNFYVILYMAHNILHTHAKFPFQQCHITLCKFN